MFNLNLDIDLRSSVKSVLYLTEAHKFVRRKKLNMQLAVLLCVEELYGDFEDLETGDVHKGQTGQQDQGEVRPAIYLNS